MYNIIKKQNGERFAQTIRNFHSGIFDVPNIDRIVQYAGNDAEPIMDYLNFLRGIKIEKHNTYTDPITMLNAAGYDAYVADSLEKQNAIKKYFAPREELCTFDDPYRYKACYIINAVHKNIDKYKRADFVNPKCDDEYATSVISIQISRSGGIISIKNRYNNSDNTFCSNPDNIINGLSASLMNFFNIDFSSKWKELPSGYQLVDKHICKYNQEINGVYFGDGFYIKNEEIVKINKDYEFLLGRGLILNLKKRTVSNVASTTDEMTALESAIKSGKINSIKYPNGLRYFYVNKKHILTVLNDEIVWMNISDSPKLTLSYFQNLSGSFDFCNIKNICFHGLNLYHVSQMKFKYINSLHFTAIKNMCGLFDFSGVDNLEILFGDFSKSNDLKFNTNAKSISLKIVSGLHKMLDFSNVENLDMNAVNLSKVPEIKLNPYGKIHIDENTLISGNKILAPYLDIIKVR